MLLLHIILASISALYGGFTLVSVFRKRQHNPRRSASILAVLLAVDITSGLLLTLQTGASVLSVCDNIALYITGFAVVFASLAYTRGFSVIAPHATWSCAYATALPVVLLSLGF